MKDLIVLAPDRDIEHAVEGLLRRSSELGIRPILHDIYVHPHRDPGCLRESQDFLRPFLRMYSHALVIFDQSGCGQEKQSSERLQEDVEAKIAANGWGERSAAVVLVPELEVWVWSDSPHVPACLGWSPEERALRTWLREKGMWPRDAAKPPDPKAALDAALHHVRKPRSSSLYRELASRVTLEGHSEPAFVRLVATLRRWFPPA